VSSATDVNAKDGKKANGEMPQRSMRANPVALEVPVSVAGARPVSSNDKRELFTEDTATVLVFKTERWIQLSAAVAVGQLLFSRKKDGKRKWFARWCINGATGRRRALWSWNSRSRKRIFGACRFPRRKMARRFLPRPKRCGSGRDDGRRSKRAGGRAEE